MDLQECRKRIDEIDEQLVSLFIERMKVVVGGSRIQTRK